MKFTINFMEDLRECSRKSEARPTAMSPVMESLFSIFPARLGKPHEHALEISSSGFTNLSSFEQFQEQINEVLANRDFSHFGFRNSIVLMVNSKFVTDMEDPYLDGDSGMMAQVFMSYYLQDAWRVDNTVAITMSREPLSKNEVDGETWIAFSVQAILPCSEEEWSKTLEVRKLELEWAMKFLADKKAKADVAAAKLLGKFNLH